MINIVQGERITCLLDGLSNQRIICIEGHTGSGKTTAGKEVANLFNAKFFDTDDYVIKDEKSNNIKPYNEMVDTQKLSHDLQNEKGRMVIAGICLRNTLKAFSLPEKPFFVYIKKISRISGLWLEEATLEELIEKKLDISTIKEPHASDYRYIIEMKPQDNADIIFERFEESIQLPDSSNQTT
ncbi:hypothetical protein F6U03_004306 [Enterobacter asburiae]|nr:hypothetical protein [Enterobacter asburiae]